MIAALRRLQSLQNATELPERVAAFGIAGVVKPGWRKLFATHPALEDRIAALESRPQGAGRTYAKA